MPVFPSNQIQVTSITHDLARFGADLVMYGEKIPTDMRYPKGCQKGSQGPWVWHDLWDGSNALIIHCAWHASMNLFLSRLKEQSKSL